MDETGAGGRTLGPSLPELAAALDRLEARACGLAHEGWRGRTGAPLFCDRMSRSVNIACAHTTARYVLRDAVLALRARGRPEAVAWLAEWQALDAEIGRCDHARSEAEKVEDAAAVATAAADHAAATRALVALHARIRVAILSEGAEAPPAAEP
ncbi:hypothetical protein [Salinarimonas sp.]|uniref:hypothetical protein n=1 Tax=Salinarimonas sp. TaxID=2766526 RepID=UPI0032D8E98A